MRYPVKALVDFGRQLLEKTGLPEDRASVVADILIEGDLFGHTTHGFQLLGPYLKELTQGGMTLAGDPDVVADHGSAVVWDGRYLPGPWLVVKAMEALVFRKDRPASGCHLQYQAQPPYRLSGRVSAPGRGQGTGHYAPDLGPGRTRGDPVWRLHARLHARSHRGRFSNGPGPGSDGISACPPLPSD